MGVLENLGPHFARAVLSSRAKAIIIEQVPSYFKSRSFFQLKKLLSPVFRFWHHTEIDAYDLGSVSTRRRGYVVATVQETDFKFPQTPAIPEHKRRTIAQVIGKQWEEGEWREIENTVMNHLLNKSGNNNFIAKKNRTLVTLEDKKLSCLIANYRKIQVTSSYLRHPEDSQKWRPFRSDEMMKILNIPSWYEFPDIVSESIRAALLGQSIDGNVIRVIGSELAYSLMSNDVSRINDRMKNSFSYSVEKNNQLSFTI